MEERIYTCIQTMIGVGNTDDAQTMLDDEEEKDAQWHYLQSQIFIAKNWLNEARKQLEIAIELDPDNEKYKEELQALKERVEKAQREYDKKNKKRKHLGGDFLDVCPEVCAEASCMCCGEACCTAICEGCGG